MVPIAAKAIMNEEKVTSFSQARVFRTSVSRTSAFRTSVFQGKLAGLRSFRPGGIQPWRFNAGDHAMGWLQLTQANTGVAIHVNMALVVLIAPSKTGGSALVTSVLEQASARIVPVLESPQQIADMLKAAAKAA